MKLNSTKIEITCVKYWRALESLFISVNALIQIFVSMVFPENTSLNKHGECLLLNVEIGGPSCGRVLELHGPFQHRPLCDSVNSHCLQKYIFHRKLFSLFKDRTITTTLLSTCKTLIQRLCLNLWQNLASNHEETRQLLLWSKEFSHLRKRMLL